MEFNSGKNEYNPKFNKEALRSILICFFDIEEYNQQKVDKLIEENPKEYAYYGKTILPMMEEFFHNDAPLETYPELLKVFREFSLVPKLEIEWVTLNISRNLRNKLSPKAKIYYDTLYKKHNLESNEELNSYLYAIKNDIEDEKIANQNPDILEDTVYNYLTDNLSKKEWEDYVNKFLDNPEELVILKKIQEKFDYFKEIADAGARAITQKKVGSEEYNYRYNILLRGFIKNYHIKILKNNA